MWDMPDENAERLLPNYGITLHTLQEEGAIRDTIMATMPSLSKESINRDGRKKFPTNT